MSRLVVSISHVEFAATDQTFYVVKVTQDADDWQVRRAYSDFRHLRDDVSRVLKDERHQLVGDDASRVFAKSFHDLPFPAKRLFGSKKDHVVKERAVELHHFLIKLLFLTHTYRKAQKQLYDTDAALHAAPPTPHHVARPHGSASVFYLLRDFLKPALARAAGGGHDGRAKNGRRAHTDDDDSDDQTRRLLRESKMLAMRASSQQQQTPQKAMSSPQLLAGTQRPRNGSTPRRAVPPPPPPPPPQPMAPEAIAAAVRRGASPLGSMADLSSIDPVQRSVHFAGHDAATAPPIAASRVRHDKTLSIGSLSATPTTKPRAESSASSRELSPVSNSSSARVSKRFNDRISANDTQPVLRAIGSDLNIIESIPDPQPRSLSSSSTASSSASFNARSLETATSLGPTTAPPPAAPANLGSSSLATGSTTTRRRPRSKKKNLSASMSSLSRAEKEMRNSERLSRLTPQLTAQTITVDAQKELEKHVSEYNAIMIMRYIDRFISKAVAKTPGCYTVLGKRLVIDCARFVAELEDVFHDLPSDFQNAFRASGSGEWAIPKALDAYVQLKWDSFQGSSATASGKGRGKHASRSAKGSDSDDSDSDYDYHEQSAYVRHKDRTFTQDESDVLQMMIAEGTAGKEQMLRLRRQHDERGWQRRTMPGAKIIVDDSDTDEDENENGSADESIKRFQQQMNAKRKSRMSHHDDDEMGGLV